ncbi:MAG TPA: PAS domain S-box protein [Nocardioides sp.]|nr:PAS domain S-box protein [Nocardioides sp.]
MRPTALIIDDSAELRTLVRARLELSDLFDVVGEAGDGSEGWMLAETLQPDVVLLDTSMPEMDGLEALPLIVAVSPHSLVVMYTGFGEAGLADRAAELGAADFIEKSLPIDELPHRLWQLLGEGRGAPSPTGALHLVTGDDADAILAQAALDEHLERYREAFSRAAIGMTILTLSGSIVRANAAFAAMVGSTMEELVGLDYGALAGGEGARFDDALQEVRHSHGEVVTFEHPQQVLGSSETRTVRVTLAPVLDSKDDALYVFAQLQDVTAEVDLRRSEELFRLLVTAVEDYAIYMLDTQGHVASWNAGAQRIKGYAEEEVLGRHFRMFYPEEEQADGHAEHNLEMAKINGSYAEEGWRVRRDGSRFWASVVITAVYDEAGQHRGFAKVTHDHTEQRAYEEGRKRAVEQQAHLLAVTAHELRTPAAVIEGSVSLLREHAAAAGDTQPKQLLDALASSARRLQRLVADLATASDVHDDALALQPEPIHLRAFLSSAVDRVRAAHPDARVTVEVDDDLTFTADPSRLGQAVDNLLENALRHGRAPVVVVGAGSDETVRICVTDAGGGVEPRLRDRLFEQFAHAGPHAGTGLGLHIVREITRSHGGDTHYLPPEQAGRTTFVIDIPTQPRSPAL